MIWVIISLLIIYFILALKKPNIALALILFLLPSYQIRFNVFAIPTTFLEGMILLFFLATLIREQFNLKNVYFSAPRHWRYLALAWLLCASLAIFVSPNKIAALGIWKAYFVEPIILFFLFLFYFQDRSQRKLFIYSLLGSAFYLSVYAIYQKITGQGVYSLEVWPSGRVLRSTGLFSYPNALGLYLAPLIMVAVGYWRSAISKFEKTFLISVIISSVLAIIFARSEGAILGIIVGGFSFGVLYSAWRKKTILAFLIFVLILVGLYSFIPGVKNYLYPKIAFKDFSSQVRLGMWRESFNMLKDHSIFGAGLAGYQKIMPPYHKINYVEIYLYPHNIVLNFWSELGLSGLIIFILIIYSFFARARDKIKKEKQNIPALWLIAATTSAMIVILAHGLVDAPYFKNDLSIIFWLINAVILVI